MASLRTQNALLFVIALCLVLLVVHFYAGHLVAKAQAAQIENPVHLYGCAKKVGMTCIDWQQVRVDPSGDLLTKP
ncbi:MAG TPA: hypothetical protein VGS22_29170 [Thermoanaerobaculia bacterium]|jgi:hypothetical protein|nr:hypothetical protein [Thermoanaerobaculia bacterium]